MGTVVGTIVGTQFDTIVGTPFETAHLWAPHVTQLLPQLSTKVAFRKVASRKAALRKVNSREGLRGTEYVNREGALDRLINTFRLLGCLLWFA